MKKTLTKLILLSVSLSFTACAGNIKKVEEKSQERNISMKNLTPDEAFLEENKLKADVVTTSSGLQYKVIAQGTGDKPNATDTVKVHYKGMLIDGTEFDSSYKRNEPISFPLNHVIKGWTEGLQLMEVGSKYILYIPSELAYGKRGAGNVIPPNSTLIFEVELLKIN